MLILFTGQASLQFPTTCPSCDHSPLEAESCTPNKALRNTMRVWLEKRKKKEEAKAAAQEATPPVEVKPAAPEVQPTGDMADKPVESVDEIPKAADDTIEQGSMAAGNAGDATERAVSTEVGVQFAAFTSHVGILESHEQNSEADNELVCLRGMNTVNAARASVHGVPFCLCCTVANPVQDTTSHQVDSERRGSTASQNVTKSIEPPATDDPIDENTANGANDGMMGNQPMLNGLQGQMGFGFPTSGGFNNGMGWNGMNQMNNMPNLMASGAWNGMNPMGRSA